MPYAGYRRTGGVAPTQDQGNPFYDPYSSAPNWGQGIQSLVQNLWQMDAMKKQEAAALAQQEFENRMKMGDYDLQRAQAEAYRRKDVTPDEPEFIKQARAYAKAMGVPIGEALKLFVNPPTAPKTPEQELDLYRGKKKIDLEYDTEAGGKAEDKEFKAYDKDVDSDWKLIQSAITKYDAEINRMDSEIAKIEGKNAQAASAKNKQQVAFYAPRLTSMQKEKDNLLQIKEYLGRLGEQSGIGQRLSPKQRAQLMSVMGGLDSAKKNPSFFRAGQVSSVPDNEPTARATAPSANTTAPERRTIKTGPDAGTWERIPGTESWRKIS